MSNKQIIFNSFEEAKKHLIANLGGSIIRLDNNEGFCVKPKQIKLSKNTGSLGIKREEFNKKFSTEMSGPVITKKKTSYRKKKLLNPNILPQSRSSPSPKGQSNHLAPGHAPRTHAPKESNNYPKQYIEENLGTRDEFKKMRGKQHFGNKTGNH